PSRLNAQVSDGLDAAVLAALAEDPADRPADGAAFARMLLELEPSARMRGAARRRRLSLVRSRETTPRLVTRPVAPGREEATEPVWVFPSASDSTKSSKEIGGYGILAQLSASGPVSVFLAHDARGRAVVLKTLSAGPEQLRRFVSEAQVAALIQQANIAR